MSSKCALPTCENEGKSRCTGCGLVAYCGRDCQRAHWKSHKPQCKQNASSPAPSPGLHSVSKSPGDGSSSSSMEAQLRSALAQAQRVDNAFECGQIHYNLSCMCVRSGSFKEAQTHAEDSIAACEKAMTQAPANIAAVKEVHVLACIGRALALVESQQFDIAEAACLETLTQAEDSFGPDNPHFIKTLRLCAMLQERQQNFDEAVAYLRRAIRSATNASNSREVQELTDELVKQLLHSGKAEEAYLVAVEHHESLTSNGAATDLNIADSLVTLATATGKSGKLSAAEEHARRALALREGALGEIHPLTAISITILAGVLEDQGKIGAETETLLQRASSIFQKIDGHRGNAMAVLNQLQRVRARREEDEGGKLMRLAGQCFESKNFKMAETHLVGAVDFYTRMFGPNHQATAAATQNLGIARQNAILQLWREVAAEEIEKRAGQGPEDISEKNQGDWERELALIGATAETKDASACSIC